jgi:hypothetical protein
MVVMNLLEKTNTIKRRLTKAERKAINIPLDKITVSDYMNRRITLTSYKLTELKQLAKTYRLHITGTKPVIITRLDKYFRDSSMATRIQKIFRAYMVIRFLKLKGPGFKNRSICNNDTDFITMEPLLEIPDALFFSYTDKNSFIYGFNAASIVQSIKNNPKLNNPYNREKMDEETIENAVIVYRLARVLFLEIRDEYERYQQSPVQPVRPTRYAPSTNPQLDYRPSLNAAYMNNHPEEQNRYRTIQEKRSRTINQRINNLFTEMDQLGNYTQISWFNNLDRAELIRLYRHIYEIWYYRGQLTHALRNNVCPFHEPFNSVFQGPVSHNNVTFEQIRTAALIVMENLVYCGVDEEYRKIGAFHALTGLTLVSRPARDAMPWLYESVL